MQPPSRLLWFSALLALTPPLAAGAGAQVVTLELSYSNPGARSMGLGGAFVALADDATAAYANPSGLVQLVRPEVSVEGRRWGYSSVYTEGGRASGQPSGRGIDTVPSLRRPTSEDDLSGVSFLSLVYPKGRWCVALYRHQQANFEMLNVVNGLFAEPPGIGGLQPGFGGTVRDEDQRTTLDLEIVNHGISGAWRVTDSFSLGLGLSHVDGSMRAITDEYLLDDASEEAYFAANSFLPERRSHSVDTTMSGADWTLSAGFLWALGRHWSVGGFYRQGPDFDLVFSLVAGPARPDRPSGTIPTPVSFPDVFGLGAAYRSTDGRVTVAFEWDQVLYSTLLESLAPELVTTGSGVVEPGTGVEDGSELRIGGEYALRIVNPVVALRLGAWLDPAHRISYEGPLDFDRALLVPGDDELHFAVGLGMAFETFQIDVGADLSDTRDTISLSAIYTF